jgi:Peptidase family S41
VRIVILALLVACSAPAKRDKPAPPMADLAADVDVLERAFHALHPGLLRYNTEADITRHFARARVELARAGSVGDAYLVLSRLTAALRCGHTFPNPTNQEKDIAATLTRAPRLPFLFRWIGERVVVTRDFSGRLPPGTQIDAIGGVTTRELFAALSPLTRTDGHNEAKRRAQLAVIGESMHEPFDILAPLLYPQLFTGPDVAIVVGATRVVVALQSAAAREAAIESAVANGPLWHAERRGEVVYLKMPTWVAYKTKWDWKASIDEIAAIDARGLVIDLRGNEGGSDVGDELAAHLIDRPIARMAVARRVRFASVPAELRPYLDTWDPSFFELGRDARDLGNGWRELTAAGEETLTPRAPRFRGKVVVLVDAANSSATFQFAQLVQRTRMGTLVGEPTGGNQRGINGGALFFVKLPRTRLEVDLPLIGTFADGAPDAGVMPDVVVETTAADLVAGRDPQLAKAIALALTP